MLAMSTSRGNNYLKKAVMGTVDRVVKNVQHGRAPLRLGPARTRHGVIRIIPKISNAITIQTFDSKSQIGKSLHKMEQ